MTADPPGDGGQLDPEVEPPAGRRDTVPPADRRDTEPPADRRDTEPPADRRDTEPPADRRDTVPRADRRGSLPPAGSGRSRRLLPKVAVAALCAVLGFGGVIQVRRTAAGDTLASARPDDLVQILDGLQRREDEENKDIAELQDTLTRLRSSGASSAEALAEAQRQAEALGILTGTVPAAGAGVRIVIGDPQRRVPPELLLDALEELRNAGAEAFQFGPVRIGVDSSFSGSGGAVGLDGTALTAPYEVLAIGDPPTLAAALAIPGGVLDTVRRAGGTMVTTQSQRIVIDALRPARTPLYARPAGG